MILLGLQYISSDRYLYIRFACDMSVNLRCPVRFLRRLGRGDGYRHGRGGLGLGLGGGGLVRFGGVGVAEARRRAGRGGQRRGGDAAGVAAAGDAAVLAVAGVAAPGGVAGDATRDGGSGSESVSLSSLLLSNVASKTSRMITENIESLSLTNSDGVY